MIKSFLAPALLFLSSTAFAQSFPSEYGQPGSTAIPKDSVCFVAWATNGTLHRGFLDINDTTVMLDGSNKPGFGTIDLAFGIAQGNITHVVSLGDSGYATLTFDQYIIDGPGFDFAVFENSFADDYMELGHVEVSSDGSNFFRFPSTSEAPIDEQQGNFTFSECEYVDNLAGKYKCGYGTPFDLDDITDNLLLNKSAITHVRIIDVIGAITGTGTVDQYGTIINDPYPTPYASGGFDLDAVGIINGTLSLSENALSATVGPNPSRNEITVITAGKAQVSVYTLSGQLVKSYAHFESSSFSFASNELTEGVYLVTIQTETGNAVRRIVYLPE